MYYNYLRLFAGYSIRCHADVAKATNDALIPGKVFARVTSRRCCHVFSEVTWQLCKRPSWRWRDTQNLQLGSRKIHPRKRPEKNHTPKRQLGGGFKYCLCSSLLGEMIQFD